MLLDVSLPVAGVAWRGLCCSVTVASSLAPEPLLWLVLPKQPPPAPAMPPPLLCTSGQSSAQPDLEPGCPSVRLQGWPASGASGCSADAAASAALHGAALPSRCSGTGGGTTAAVLAASAAWLAAPLLLTSAVTASAAAPPLLSCMPMQNNPYAALHGATNTNAQFSQLLSVSQCLPNQHHKKQASCLAWPLAAPALSVMSSVPAVAV